MRDGEFEFHGSAQELVDQLNNAGYKAHVEGSNACGGSNPAHVSESNPSGHWHPVYIQINRLTPRQVGHLLKIRTTRRTHG